MPVDNTIYDQLGATWWDENASFSALRIWVNPARFAYFREVLLEQCKIDPAGKKTLDVGCGGGLLAEEFARLGCNVTGIDPSEASLNTARAHAQQESLSIEYRSGAGEALPFADASFDIVYCADVLEHVNDLHTVLSEISRVLIPGGVFLYDTINRTIISNLIFIKLLQEWETTSSMPPNTHAWNMFIKPHELQTLMQKHLLASKEIVGLAPHLDPFTTYQLLRKQKQGKLSVQEVGNRLRMGKSKSVSASYMGYAIKSSETL